MDRSVLVPPVVLSGSPDQDCHPIRYVIFARMPLNFFFPFDEDNCSCHAGLMSQRKLCVTLNSNPQEWTRLLSTTFIMSCLKRHFQLSTLSANQNRSKTEELEPIKITTTVIFVDQPTKYLHFALSTSTCETANENCIDYF